MKLKSTLFAVLMLATLFACQSNSAKDKDIRAQARKKLEQPQSDSRINKYNDNKVEVSGPTTKIQFEEKSFDFGTVPEGSKVRHEYKFKNVGTTPLVIQDAKASCGCTVPSFSKEPVPPGGSGKIEVVFDSKGRPGKAQKYVTITSNTEPIKTKLFLTGEVKPKKK